MNGIELDYEFKYRLIKEAIRSLNYDEVINFIMEFGLN